ncbi:hypothetical protein EVAR_26701_1 [Eumeta japonica]|uniref:Uncharacterized protein n=1 Tax=Eumeta variegata TaxID=151549 RepID=A0A4C1ZPE6_EUMVA|nr:hypothetical protein EVAR_26701_1 [Eumeta japonica]
MAPTRLIIKAIVNNENANSIWILGVTMRSKQMASLKTYKDPYNGTNKRKADSPLKDNTAKRAAFGDITNAFNKTTALKDQEQSFVYAEYSRGETVEPPLPCTSEPLPPL